jgi:hypothetical protein
MVAIREVVESDGVVVLTSGGSSSGGMPWKFDWRAATQGVRLIRLDQETPSPMLPRGLRTRTFDERQQQPAAPRGPVLRQEVRITEDGQPSLFEEGVKKSPEGNDQKKKPKIVQEQRS